MTPRSWWRRRGCAGIVACAIVLQPALASATESRRGGLRVPLARSVDPPTASGPAAPDASDTTDAPGTQAGGSGLAAPVAPDGVQLNPPQPTPAPVLVRDTPPSSDVDLILARFQREPAIDEVQSWAASVARVDPRSVGRWLADARRFAALPEVRLEYGFGDDWSSDYDSFDAFGNPPTTEEAATEQVRTSAGTGRSQDVGVKATWDLPSLLMSSERLRAIDQAIDAAKLRGTLLEEVTRLYFARRRLQVDMLLAPRLDAQGRVEDALKLEELTAQLDAFTGGRFREALSR